jgi:hypothetical protein
MQVVTTTTTVDSIIYDVSTTTTSATASAPKSCPTQVLINGGFEDGTTTPFVFSEGPRVGTGWTRPVPTSELVQ